jgi:hypothetical protein
MISDVTADEWSMRTRREFVNREARESTTMDEN